jgi:hypothetical protein
VPLLRRKIDHAIGGRGLASQSKQPAEGLPQRRKQQQEAQDIRYKSWDQQENSG